MGKEAKKGSTGRSGREDLLSGIPLHEEGIRKEKRERKLSSLRLSVFLVKKRGKGQA